MKLNKVESNSLFETIVAVGLDPTEFRLRTGAAVRWPGIVHPSSGSYFKMKPANFVRGFNTRRLVGNGRQEYRNKLSWDQLILLFGEWCVQVKAPDLWTELKQAGMVFTTAQREEPENTPFTQDEQNEIVAQLQTIKRELPEKFELSSEQITLIEQKLDEAAEASKRMGRKDWLLLFGGTIFTVIVTDIVTPDVAHQIFIMAIHGLAHLFTGRSEPPQIPSGIIA